MTKRTVQPSAPPQFTAFIKENMPTLEALNSANGQNQSASHSVLQVPQKLQSEEEDLLLDTAFRYLFHLNVARETRAEFDVEKLRAIEGNRLVKKKQPLNLIYDFLYVSAKTRILGYVKRAPYTVPYNRMALKIYGACFLFGQLDLIAQTGVVSDKLDTQFYFLPKGTFVDEFEQMNELALSGWLSTLSKADTVQFYQSAADAAKDTQHTGFMVNDCFVQVDTSETSAAIEEALEEVTRLFFLNQVRKAAVPAFCKAGIYRARYGEMNLLDLEAYYGNRLDSLVKEADEYLS